MYTLILFFPVFSFFLLILFGRFLGKYFCSFFSILNIFISLCLSFFIFYEVVLMHYVCYLAFYNWISFNFLNINFELYFDSLSSIMLLIILIVSFCVHLFSIEYMWGDPHYIRFMAYLALFTFFMLILVLSSNFIQLFLGWEGVGLSSYLLINFWFNRIEANRSAMKAIILNRFGDVGLYLSILLIYFIFKSLNIFVVFSLVPYIFNFNNYFLFLYNFINLLNLIGILIFIAAAGKSAQLGLHVWLPDAMEGPTPVSALIHAATMVTAGVFLLIRMSPILEFCPLILSLIMFFGAFTAFFSSLIGLVQNDIKKVIAYSTCSQLGYMVFSCGFSNYFGALFHLFNHAFFKALLFLGAGAIIHSFFNEQDIRKYGGSLKILPFSYISFLVGSFSLAGLPFLSGYYSKDYIIESAYADFSFKGSFIFWLGSLTVLCTVFYSFRLLYFIFFIKTNTTKSLIFKMKDSSIFILIPLMILMVLSIFSGYWFFDLFLGLGVDAFEDSIYVLINNNNKGVEFIPLYIKLIPLFFTLKGLILGIGIYYWKIKVTKYFFFNKYLKVIYMYLNKKFFFDLIYFYFIIQKVLYLSFDILYKLIDRGVLEIIGPIGLVRITKVIMIKINNFQQSIIIFYLRVFFCFFIFFLSFYFFLNIYYLNILIYIILLGIKKK